MGKEGRKLIVVYVCTSFATRTTTMKRGWRTIYARPGPPFFSRLFFGIDFDQRWSRWTSSWSSSSGFLSTSSVWWRAHPLRFSALLMFLARGPPSLPCLAFSICTFLFSLGAPLGLCLYRIVVRLYYTYTYSSSSSSSSSFNIPWKK